MKLATWNVNSITARLPLVTRWIEEARPDVLCLQEIKCTDDRFPADAFAALGYESTIFGQRTYNGVAIVSREKCRDVQRGFPDDAADAHARLLAGTVDGVRIVNVYIPNGQAVGTDKYVFKLGWMRRLREFFDASYTPRQQVLLCGDFNVAPEDRDVHNPKLWEHRVLFSKPEREALSEIKDWGFVDAFRLHNDEPKQFSWWDYRAGSFKRNLGLRIDHIWTTERLAARTTGAAIDAAPRSWERPSDHAPVIVEMMNEK
ncbi:MAG: exodeoxyribonuclease III [Blastocatellia bacterium]